ncbi:MAG: outer membrane beta-barrel protein [Chlamydiales bacterium]|nr:outer membrane beta-barrel protein [Chlamydiales bacterium]
MLKSILKSTIAVLCVFASQANAQDFCCCDSGFNGFYIGGNIGVSSHTSHRNDYNAFLTDNSGWSAVNTGFIGGVQAGYDWSNGGSVFGILADWDATTHRHTHHEVADNAIRNRLSWISTIRARAGVTVSDALIYITGGAAVAHLRTTWNDDPTSFTHTESRWGWVGGFGTEYKYCDSWNIGAEMLYMNFANSNRSFDGFTFGHSDSSVQGRLFVNWSFSDLFASY